MNNCKNVLIISQALSGGGAEKLAANLSLGLKEKANVTIVTYWKSEKEYDYAGERINLDLVGNGIISKICCALKRIFIIKKIKKQKKIDCSISYVPPCDYANVLSRVKNEKIIIDVVSNMSTVYKGGLSKWFRKYVLQHADFLVTVSEGVRKDLIDHFGVKESGSKTIYNSCDIEAVTDVVNCSKRENSVIHKKYIVSMGSFRQPKGHWHLIKAFATIKNDIEDIDLVILGDGGYRQKYYELIERLDLSNRVHLPGFINPPFGVISKAEVFVFSSVFEGFGNAVNESFIKKYLLCL